MHRTLKLAGLCALAAPDWAFGSDASKGLARIGGKAGAAPEPEPYPDDRSLVDASAVGRFHTDKARGGFSFGPVAPPQTGLEVAVHNASLATFFQELLNGRTLPGKVPVVEDTVGAISSGELTHVTITRALVGGGVRAFPCADKETLEIKIPQFAAQLSADYSVRFTQLRVPSTGSMHLTLQDGSVRLGLPLAGSGAGSCSFGSDTRLLIESSSPLKHVGGDSIDDGLKSLAASVNENMLSLQDKMLHTVERGLCAALLASFGEADKADFIGLRKQPEGWQAMLLRFGMTPLELVVGLGLCIFSWTVGACCFAGPRCCCCCCAPRSRFSGPELLPLQAGDDGTTYGYAHKGGLFASLTCCRRSSRSSHIIGHDGF